MSKPKELTVYEFSDIIATELQAFVRQELKNQQKRPYEYKGEGETKFTARFGDWMENFSCRECLIPENQEKIGG